MTLYHSHYHYFIDFHYYNYNNVVECQFPVQNNQTVKIVEVNGTVLGSELHFKCHSDSDEELKTAVCSSNGTWFPDPDNYECQAEGKHVQLLGN